MTIDANSIDPFSLDSVSYEDRYLLPMGSGIYFALIAPSIVNYIGLSRCIRKRWYRHTKRKNLNLKALRIAWLPVPESDLRRVEEALINRFKPPLNGIALPPDADYQEPRIDTRKGETEAAPTFTYYPSFAIGSDGITDYPRFIDDDFNRHCMAETLADLIKERREKMQRLCEDPEFAEMVRALDRLDGLTVRVRELVQFYFHNEVRVHVVEKARLSECGISVCGESDCPEARQPEGLAGPSYRSSAFIEIFNYLVPQEMRIGGIDDEGGEDVERGSGVPFLHTKRF